MLVGLLRFPSRRLLHKRKIVSVKSLRMAATAATETTSKLEAIPSVDIDVGRFKYVLIRVDHVDPEMKKEYSKVIVRGYLWAAFHADVYDKVQEEMTLLGLDTECLGGGRILHEPDKKSIEVFGYSQGFGLADHSLTTEILKTHYKDYKSITWTNEGY